MDEAAQLGLGKYLRENGYTKSSVLIREHSARVFEICKKLGLEPMIWSDMYITANTGGGYYDLADDTDCSDWEKPDPDLGLVYWDYYNPEQKIYEKMIRVHQQLSNKVIFARRFLDLERNITKLFQDLYLHPCGTCRMQKISSAGSLLYRLDG